MQCEVASAVRFYMWKRSFDISAKKCIELKMDNIDFLRIKMLAIDQLKKKHNPYHCTLYIVSYNTYNPKTEKV